MNPISRNIRSSIDMADDRLSQLPNDLLITILSSTLTLKEAAATSILSERWKTLWTYFYGFLDFDYHPHLPFEKTYSRQIEECSGEYVNYVNKVLGSHQDFGVPINKFRICWRLLDEYNSVIDSWIDFAMKKVVHNLELDLCLPAYNCSNYKFPHGIGFPNLNVLQLSSVDLTEETLAYLISSDECPSLQHLSVKSARSLVHVKVVGNLKLKSLEFAQCSCIKDVEICSAVNMVSFGFSGKRDTKITFEDVPSLTEARFGLDYCENVAMQLSSSLSNLEVLVLDSPRYDYLQKMSWSPPKFDTIKQLELQSDTPYSGYWNLCVMRMIYKCPRLQKFSLKMTNTVKKWLCPIQWKVQCQHRHECLRAVEYRGWNGNEDELELISDILEISVLLDKVTIDPRTIFSHKSHETEVKFSNRKFNIHDKKREEGARNAAEKLRTILPERVTLVIL